MVTAYGDPDTRRKTIASGAADLPAKPIDFALLRGETDARVAQANQAPYSAISGGGVAGPASGRSSIATMESPAVARSTAAAPNT